MEFIKTPVQSIMVTAKCEKCDTLLVYNNSSGILATYPPKYSHICPKCGEVYLLDAIYPKIEYEIRKE